MLNLENILFKFRNVKANLCKLKKTLLDNLQHLRISLINWFINNKTQNRKKLEVTAQCDRIYNAFVASNWKWKGLVTQLQTYTIYIYISYNPHWAACALWAQEINSNQWLWFWKDFPPELYVCALDSHYLWHLRHWKVIYARLILMAYGYMDRKNHFIGSPRIYRWCD